MLWTSMPPIDDDLDYYDENNFVKFDDEDNKFILLLLKISVQIIIMQCFDIGPIRNFRLLFLLVTSKLGVP